MRGSCEIYRYDSIRGNNDEMLTGGKGVEGSTRTQIRNSEYDDLFLDTIYVLVNKDRPRLLESHEVKHVWNRHEKKLVALSLSVFCNSHLLGASPVRA